MIRGSEIIYLRFQGKKKLLICVLLSGTISPAASCQFFPHCFGISPTQRVGFALLTDVRYQKIFQLTFWKRCQLFQLAL